MKKSSSLGVVIGRFQIHELHAGHRHLIDYVSERHQKVLILVGTNSIRFTTSDPFPFHIRRQMLETSYPDAVIKSLQDSPIGNEHWSCRVDETVREVSEGGPAVLYGSRDSFIPKYHGVFPTELVPELPLQSATKVRAEAAKRHLDEVAFRLGWLAAIKEQFVVTDPTVDVVIHTPDWSKILMGRRDPSSPLRFFGGFVDHLDQSYEAAAIREQTEEALGIEVGEPVYIGSQRIDDPRYKRTSYGPMTTFFAMEYVGGEVEAGDDMGVAEWVTLTPALRADITSEHQVLFDLLLRYQEKQTQ